MSRKIVSTVLALCTICGWAFAEPQVEGQTKESKVAAVTATSKAQPQAKVENSTIRKPVVLWAATQENLGGKTTKAPMPAPKIVQVEQKPLASPVVRATQKVTTPTPVVLVEEKAQAPGSAPSQKIVAKTVATSMPQGSTQVKQSAALKTLDPPAVPKPRVVKQPKVKHVQDVLHTGAKGFRVKNIQQKLNMLGIKTPVTGIYNDRTALAVRTFQAKYKITKTGLVDRKTYELILRKATEKERQAERDKQYAVTPQASKILKTAAMYRGCDYAFGGTSPDGFDCSGFVFFVFARHGLYLPRSADEQFYHGKKVARRDLKPGDLVFFSTYEDGPSHVGIYAGNGRFWHASTSVGITLSGMNDYYWCDRYYSACRILR